MYPCTRMRFCTQAGTTLADRESWDCGVSCDRCRKGGRGIYVLSLKWVFAFPCVKQLSLPS